jgi:hypothetical protein
MSLVAAPSGYCRVGMLEAELETATSVTPEVSGKVAEVEEPPAPTAVFVTAI